MPSAASAAARLAVTLDLPTPPLPDPMQITLLTWASAPSGRVPRPSLRPSACFSGSESTSKLEVDAGDALHPANRLVDPGLEVTADRAAGGRQRDHHIDDAVGMDIDRAHHLELDDVTAQLGVDHGAQRLGHLVFGRHAIHSSRRARAALECRTTAPGGSLPVARRARGTDTGRGAAHPCSRQRGGRPGHGGARRSRHRGAHGLGPDTPDLGPCAAVVIGTAACDAAGRCGPCLLCERGALLGDAVRRVHRLHRDPWAGGRAPASPPSCAPPRRTAKVVTAPSSVPNFTWVLPQLAHRLKARPPALAMSVAQATAGAS